jgi:hypothetical protein
LPGSPLTTLATPATMNTTSSTLPAVASRSGWVRQIRPWVWVSGGSVIARSSPNSRFGYDELSISR